jgi:hypothetical protein
MRLGGERADSFAGKEEREETRRLTEEESGTM